MLVTKRRILAGLGLGLGQGGIAKAQFAQAVGPLPSAVGLAAVGQIPGTGTNDSASAGNVGEYIESVVAQGSAVSLSTLAATNMTSIPLTAGDWDVDLVMQFLYGSGTTVSSFVAGVSTASGVLDLSRGRAIAFPGLAPFTTSEGIVSLVVPPLRFTVANGSSSTIFAIARVNFAANTMSVYGILRARRVR